MREPEEEDEELRDVDPMEGEWMEGETGDKTQTQPLPAPILVPTPMRNRGGQPVFIPLHTSKGPSPVEPKVMGHPTPLSHPRNLSNPLAQNAGRPLPILPPIMDPNHPVNQGRGWIAMPTSRQKGGKVASGWMPPQPPQPQPQSIRMGYQQQPCSHNQMMNQMYHAATQGFADQQYRIALPGVMGPYACNWDAADPDSGYEP